MSAIGIDINPGYRDVFIERLGLLFENSDDWVYEVRDARSMSEVAGPESVDICVTSPPYWDILTRRRSADGKSSRPYSENKQDLGNISDYNLFVSSLCEVTRQVESALRQRSYFVLNVMDLRKGGQFYPLHSDASSAILSKTNLILEDIIIWDRQSEYNAMRPLGYPSKFIINKVHEYLLVFRKPRR